ncbi:hypothetical protein BC832DRAFT_611882 [Gaertneriomyces semiglobifer]|nr:hypothetical protein BC832DRAFT_611882 [Gaertneriomyces semiglobifer]
MDSTEMMDADDHEQTVGSTEDAMQANQDQEMVLPLLELISEARQMHGLRHEDYQRYRQFCTQKLRTLRRSVGLSQNTTPAKSSGKSKAHSKFLSKPISPENATTSRHLMILLFECERHWAYAMELKEFVRDEPRKTFHQVKRLVRAVKFGNTLKEVVAAQKDRLDVRSIYEVEGYAALLSAHHQSHCRQHVAALKSFARARAIFSHLASVGPKDQRLLSQNMLDEIDPAIRFSAYQQGNKNAQRLAVTELMQGHVEQKLVEDLRTCLPISDTDDVSKLRIQIRDEDVVVPTPLQDLVHQSLRQPQAPPAGDTKADVLALCAPITSAHTLTLRAIRKQVAAAAKGAVKMTAARSELVLKELRLLEFFVMSLRAETIIARDSLLIEKSDLSTPLEKVTSLFENILGQLASLKSHPAVIGDATYPHINDARVLYYRSSRARFLASTHMRDKSYQGNVNALGLLERASEHLTQSRAMAAGVARMTGLNDEDTKRLNDLDERLKELEMRIRQGVVIATARVAVKQAKAVDEVSEQVSKLEISQDQSDETVETPLPLISTLHSFKLPMKDGKPYVVDWNRVLPVPAKPMFFDMAYNGIEYRTEILEARARGESVDEAKKSVQERGAGGERKGLLGSVFGLWGRK